MSGLAGPGAILELIRRGGALTRTQIMQATGLSRSTLAKRIDALIAHGYVDSVETTDSSGGRPPAVFTVNRETGVMLLAAIDADTLDVVLCDMARTMLARETVTLPVGDRRPRGFETFDVLVGSFDALLAKLGRTRSEVKGVGIGIGAGAGISVPAAFDECGVSGTPDREVIGERLAAAYACPVLVDRCVNLAAVAEHRIAWPAATHLLCLDVGNAIDAALIVDGALQRGAHGAAGDIAHLPVGDLAADAQAICRCGRAGCLEAQASARAILRDLVAKGHRVGDVNGIAELAQNGVYDAVDALRHAGRMLGEAIAVAVNLFNPSLVVLGGELARCQNHLLAALRETVYQRSSARATRHLQIVASTLGEAASLTGAALLVSDAAHAPDAVDAQIARFG